MRAFQSCFKQACKHPRSPEGCPLGEQCPFSHEPCGPTEPRTLKQGNGKTTHRATENTVFTPGPQNRGPPLAVAKKKYINVASGRPSVGPTTAQQPAPARNNESLSSCECHEATMSTQPSAQHRYSTVSLVVSNTTASDQRTSGRMLQLRHHRRDYLIFWLLNLRPCLQAFRLQSTVLRLQNHTQDATILHL